MGKSIVFYVAIIGGFWKIVNDDPAKFEEAKKTGLEIGEALAKAGLGIVVYFSHRESLEPHVVAGYVNALPAGAREKGEKPIRVRFPESQRGIVRFDEQTRRPELFDTIVISGQEWEAPFYRSLVAAEGVDGVLLMAGDRSTLIAGQIAVARPLPMLAIDGFAGAAAVIRSELARNPEGHPSSATHNAAQMVDWLNGRIEQRAQEKAEARLRQSDCAKMMSQRGKTVAAAGAFLALLGVLFLGVRQSPNIQYYLFLEFVGMIAAGATGAMGRSLFWGEETASTASLFLGGLAGFIVGLAYLIPQLVAAPAALQSASVEATVKIQFLYAILVAIPAGVGFDIVFARLKEQAKVQPIGIPGKG